MLSADFIAAIKPKANSWLVQHRAEQSAGQEGCSGVEYDRERAWGPEGDIVGEGNNSRRTGNVQGRTTELWGNKWGEE